jgi:hypothetical protein
VLGACWPLTKFWEILGHIDLFWDFDSLSKEELQDEAEITGSRPTFGSFLGFWEYVTGMGCRPMGLPMFRPILYV